MASESLNFTDEQKQTALAMLNAAGDPWTPEQLDEALEVIGRVAQGDPIGTARRRVEGDVTFVALRLDAGNGPIWRCVNTEATVWDQDTCDWPLITEEMP
ncbi:hypothetical protein ACQI4L_09025 [Mycolicibacterium litorale]|uniref:hypothetical protein n=1 Tax=Mycolicibacterium litorale TaxID=758802 RepID=UPI003CED5750